MRFRAFFAAGMLLAAPTIQADTILLKNGDRITGTVTKIDAGKVSVTTPFAGAIDIGMEHVQSIATDAPVAIEKVDGGIQEGQLSVTDTKQQITVDATPTDIPLETVKRAAPDRETLDKSIRKAARIWTGTVDTAAIFRSGETDRFDATLDLSLVRTRPIHTLTLRGLAAYGETDSSLNTQRAFGEAKWQYFFTGRRLYAFGLTTAEHDKLRRLESRYAVASGLGYKIIDTEPRKLTGELGFEYAFERWENFGIGEYNDKVDAARMLEFNNLRALLEGLSAGTIAPDLMAFFRGARIIRNFAGPELGDKIRSEDYPSGRIALSYYQKLFKRSTLTDDLVVLPRIEDFGEFRVTNTLAFMTPVNEHISIRMSLLTQYDSDPGAEDIDKFDNTLTLGLRYSF